ncbi:hypothetical protein NOR51B_1730 [Luminiphilus syltensis NOR5-1B]|uniref:HTH merR-type domain-containing protein n=1 Tax=Luminiphilus syltensis NOR5-1B TaxID=565045 RepID=B8KQQ6_9GAMM|nr:MerR family transcriptional regulator [Luminiphilus syltensis]EED35783.1 hypothetical protein NOR51B_1730 [Luminiphilus syltensis NOR5-1B]
MNAVAEPSGILEPRPLYGIGTVARLTGLKPDTLRVWERRYGLGASYKSATGRRQYTQSDLDHLQLIAALVADGTRIGEIASAESKTLAQLVKARGDRIKVALPAAKSTVVFVGRELCHWLDGHQGCISGVSAFMVRETLTEQLDELTFDGEIDLLVIECPSLSASRMQAIQALRARLQVGKVLVLYRYANERWLEELERHDASGMEFPPEPARLAFEFSRLKTARDTTQGQYDMGELVQPKDRTFTDEELIAAGKLKSLLDCECPKHIADLLMALNHFETYSSECSVDNWRDAAVHSSIYAYTNQARWLMEKALKAVLENRGQEFQQLLAEAPATTRGEQGR